MPKLFGTSGIRGPADSLFTKEFCLKLGVVYGQWLKDKGKSGYVAIAMDPRESSPRIKEHIIAGLAVQGFEILDEGVIPTPALTYFVHQSPPVGGGVMVTGSHITANLNGVKLFVDGEEVTKQHEVEIEQLFQNFEFKTQVASPIIKYESAAKELYIQMLTDLADLPYPKWKIIVDTANGTQSEIIRELFLNLNLNFTCTDYCDVQSPHFVPRDTESQGGVVEIIRDVLTTRADLGVAFDVDGDRVVFIDDLGRFVPGDFSCSLIAQESSSSKIVTPISTSSVIDQLGKKIYRTPVGSTYVAAKMKEVGATFGFEPNGGGISGEIFYGRDGGSTMIKMLNILKVKNQSLANLYSSLPQYFIYRSKVDCPQNKYNQIYASVREKYSDKQIEDMDGIKINLEHEEWILFRASGNAPEFRVFSQSKDMARADKLGQDGLAWVSQIIHPTLATSATPLVNDSLHIKESIIQFPDQFKQVMSDIPMQHVPHECMLVKNIVLAGMGGSALAGRILQSLDQQLLKVPFTVSTEFNLPNFVDEQTLVIVSSYSGNTEESLCALSEALACKARIYVLTSGGALARIATEKNIPAYIFVPQHNPSAQPRMGLGYSLAGLLFLLSRCQFIKFPERLPQVVELMQARRARVEKIGQELASQVVGKSIVILASEHLKGAAHAVKNMLNENAKTMSFLFDLPEANHHLLEGLGYPANNPENYLFLNLNSSLYRTEVSKTYPKTIEIMRKQHFTVIDFPLVGDDQLMECLNVIQTGAWISYYLAGYNHIDPGPIPWIDYLKDIQSTSS